jgi:diguanylate cyclase (GGDEF)-like protein
VVDSDGAVSEVRTVTFNIAAINDAPVAFGESFTMDQSTVLSGSGLLLNDSDLESDLLQAVLFLGPSHGTLTLSPDGSFVYSPESSYYGSDAFSYRVWDGEAFSNVVEVTLNIRAVQAIGGNNPPPDPVSPPAPAPDPSVFLPDPVGFPELNSQLVGRRASTLPWMSTDFSATSAELPWQRVLRGEEVRQGEMLRLQTASEEARKFMVNSTMILDDQGNSQGALTSFGDVTPLERKKLELAEMLKCLQKSSEEIRRQNSELERLALEDPLTGCLNRRSFFESFETLWDEAVRQGRPLSCVMTDIDYFKSINDNFGHSFGDEVLRAVAKTLKQTAREADIVCRYGGEEFCVLMRNADPEAAAHGAERLRQAVASIKLPKVTVTASFGLSSTVLGAQNNQELLDQADKALSLAKRNGRNCVVRFDEVPADLVVDETSISRTRRASAPAVEKPIPFHAVIALISALAYRDLPTAEHSRRVADLCVLVAEGLISPSQCYLLEIAALLHDIGKIGVPDSILLKAGRLNAEEAEVMRTYQRIGIELVRASFKSPELCAILENRTTPPDAVSDPGKPGSRSRIPVGARILAIADSYDAMTRDSVYRRGMTPDAAFAELRRCVGSQFDPELVERFIACVKSRRPNHGESGRDGERDRGGTRPGGSGIFERASTGGRTHSGRTSPTLHSLTVAGSCHAYASRSRGVRVSDRSCRRDRGPA